MRALAAQLRVELTLTLRNGESLLLTLGIPVAVLVFFSVVDVLPIEGDAVDFLAPGTLALAVLATAFANLAIATGFDRSYGVLKRLGTTPLGRPRLVAAKALAVLAVIALQAVVLGAAALALGWRPEVEPVPLAAAVVLAVAAFVGLALVVAGRLPALAALAVANAVFVALLLLSGMVVPLAELPGGVRSVARALPSTALAEAARGALTEGVAVPGRVWPVLLVWALAAVALAIALFRWEPADCGHDSLGHRRHPRPDRPHRPRHRGQQRAGPTGCRGAGRPGCHGPARLPPPRAGARTDPPRTSPAGRLP